MTLRHPRTTQEIREFCAAKVDHRYDSDVPKMRRSRRTLPTAYDDIWASEHRCWKKYRKTQYRPKELPKQKKRGKFRGHLNPRFIIRYSKKEWYWNVRLQYLCWRRKVIRYYEGDPKSKKVFIQDQGEH